MRFFAKPAALVLLTSLVACSGGGGSSPGDAGPGVQAKPQTKAAKVGVSIHIPASLATTASVVGRRTAAGSRVGPKFVSPSSNGLAVQVYADMTHATKVDEVDFDISSTSASCTADGSGGRTCSIQISEPANESLDFVISTYASAPASSTSGFGSAPSLDSTDAGLYTFSTTATTTISATLGGTVTAIKLSVATTFPAYAASPAIPVGVTALDAAGDVIVSSAPYASTITLGVTSSAGSSVAIDVNGTQATQGTTTQSSDKISLVYGGNTPAAAGDVITVSATSTAGASATATTAPLYVTGSPTQATIVQSQGVFVISPTSGTQDALTFTEGRTYTGPLTVTADPASPCVSSGSATASATSPLLFSTSANGAKSTTPPTVQATNGVAASLYVTTAGFATPGSGCVYDVADTSGASVPFTIESNAYVPCPGNNLYVNYDSPGPQGGAGLEKFTLPLTANSVPTQLEGNGQTVWLSFDPSCNAYITNYFSTVAEYASPFTGSPTYTYDGSANTDPYGAAADGAGHLFVDQSSANTVVEVQMSSGTVLNTLTVQGPYSIAFDSKANLYVGGSQGISEFAPPYTQSTLVATILTSVAVQGIAFSASDTLFAVGNNSLTVLSPPYGTGNVIATNHDPSFSTPLGLAVDARGNVYVPNYGNSTIAVFGSPYTGAPSVTLNVSGALPDADAIGP